MLIGGSMGTESYILAGTRESEQSRLQFLLPWRGSRHEPACKATKRWHGREVVEGTGEPRHPDPQPVPARRGGGSPGGLQGCWAGGGGHGPGRTIPQGGTARAADLHQGMSIYLVEPRGPVSWE